MSYNKDNFDISSRAISPNVVLTYTYQNTSDTLATIVASGYFNTITARLKINDLIYARGSDDAATLRVTSATAATTVTTTIESEESVELVEGSMLIGNSAGISTALDVSGDTKIVVGNATTATSVALSGDITMTNAGVTSIGSDKVVTAKILDANVTKAKLAVGISASHMAVYGSASFTTVGGSAAETIRTVGSSPQTIVSAAVTTDTLTVTFSGDPSNDHVIDYMIVRATS